MYDRPIPRPAHLSFAHFFLSHLAEQARVPYLLSAYSLPLSCSPKWQCQQQELGRGGGGRRRQKLCTECVLMLSVFFVYTLLRYIELDVSALHR